MIAAIKLFRQPSVIYKWNHVLFIFRTFTNFGYLLMNKNIGNKWQSITKQN